MKQAWFVNNSMHSCLPVNDWIRISSLLFVVISVNLHRLKRRLEKWTCYPKRLLRKWIVAYIVQWTWSKIDWVYAIGLTSTFSICTPMLIRTLANCFQHLTTPFHFCIFVISTLHEYRRTLTVWIFLFKTVETQYRRDSTYRQVQMCSLNVWDCWKACRSCVRKRTRHWSTSTVDETNHSDGRMDEIDISFDHFHKYFVVGFAVTAHKMQGETVRERFMIHDWDALEMLVSMLLWVVPHTKVDCHCKG